MFFAAFFGALFYIRNLSVPDLGAPDSKLLWPDYTSAWPTVGPYIREQFTPMAAMGIPLLNTIILVSSGFTLTIAHHALKAGHRGTLKLWLAITIALGFTFLGFQAYEYFHAYSALNLKLSTGVYGSTFFMLTGFHGAHVSIGAIMLSVMLARAIKGHFDADHHFAFEAAAWYWHFVDVVWLLLFVLVYWLRGAAPSGCASTAANRVRVRRTRTWRRAGGALANFAELAKPLRRPPARRRRPMRPRLTRTRF
jgi:cytochrome c oxidase subunit 3